ncbi:NFX1-type zinc finger-containing protein 1-like [Phlebotomus argentipes]|uniref:NFX1-type zinc finger-containing protein 1-like n=1 Tax=Phlebotomus argentipes TaxID=94469 RepID=UPI002892B9C0|nr:NFX1-type zinc finger-containing protein 1-like [Phlebotomus argentipes]
MSDSDDNWFDKDIEEFQVPIKKKTVDLTAEQLEEVKIGEDENPKSSGSAFGLPEDYGGSYNIKVPSKLPMRNTDNNSKKTRGKNSASQGEIQKMSKKELLEISKKNPLDVFLEIMGKALNFKELALEKQKSHETIILLIVVLGKLHQVPLNHNLEHFMAQILMPDDVLQEDLLSYVKYAVDLEEKKTANLLPFSDLVWTNLESLCGFGMRFNGQFNRWAVLTLAICEILEGKRRESLVEKHSRFSKLSNDITTNYFYSETIYASLDDLKDVPSKRSWRKKRIAEMVKNSDFADASEYLAFQLTHLKNTFVYKLFEGVKKFNQQRGEKRRSIVLEDISGTNIFPFVRIRKSFPQIMSFSDKYFLLDLAPHVRVDHRLPENVREEVTKRDFQFIPGSLLFLSTSPLFEDLIVAEIPFLPVEVQREGFLIVDIVRLENIKGCILNSNLILVTIPFMFEPVLQNLRALQKISTATLPMKEYLVNCKAAAVLPDYENLEEYAFSLEKINLRAEEHREDDLKMLGMNESQFEAFRMALTRRLTVIQGPPGTGKTTVALNIIQRLLTNTSLRILIVSYRNFSLDKLLMRCSTLTDKIVRLGLQLADPGVKKFTLDRSIVDPRHYAVQKQSLALYSEAMEKFVDTMKNLEVDGKTEKCTLDEDFERLRQATLREAELVHLRMYYGCKDARIIGMTTSGAAKYHTLLELLRPSVVIIEEAAEVPESHVITSLTQHTQQLVLIGDHMQLTYSLDIDMGRNCTPKSLFERLVQHGANDICLNIQYRMHPDMADLLRNTIYHDYSDGENVKQYKAIRGISKNLYFISHENLETLARERYKLLQQECPIKKSEDTSKENFYEMLFTVGLANYLRQQGYKSDEIVILTAYSGQQFAIGSILVNFPLLKGVEVHTVDSFQGQEARIVILSLVRSNEKSMIGFLTSKNRLCVLLSRAQEGFYIVGNMEALVRRSNDWEDIAIKLEAKDAIGPGLPIKCEKHGGEMIATGLEDFLKFTRDGCPIGESLPKTRKHPCINL